MRGTSLFVLVLVFCVWLDSPGRTCAQQKAEALVANADQIARAKEIYRRDCLVCHGATGEGQTDILRDREMNLPDWTDPKSLVGRMDQQLFNVIRFGRGKMPAERAGRADDADVRGLVHYIRSMAKHEAATLPTAGSTALKK